jgi:hypothetical protein
VADWSFLILLVIFFTLAGHQLAHAFKLPRPASCC